VLNHGIIQQTGSPETLYRSPGNLFVASFVGSPSMNLLDVTLEEGILRLGARQIYTGISFSGPVKIGVRPEAIKINDGIAATVALVENLGARFLIDARVDGRSFMVLSDERPCSDTIGLHIDPRDIHVFDKNTGENLRRSFDGHIGIPQS
jgi:ABC-type sugar transport system ATPase subunit